MKRILCTLPNASSKINGVSFSSTKAGMLSEEIDDEKAEAFAAIDGYEIVEEREPEKKPAPAPTPAPAPAPAPAPTPAPTPPAEEKQSIADAVADAVADEKPADADETTEEEKPADEPTDDPVEEAKPVEGEGVKDTEKVTAPAAKEKASKPTRRKKPADK